MSAEEASMSLCAAYRMGAIYRGQIERIRSGDAEGQERLLWEVVLAAPLALAGLKYRFVPESHEPGTSTPDWEGRIEGIEVAFEACTKALPPKEISGYRRSRDEFEARIRKEVKQGRGGVFFLESEMPAFGHADRVSKTEKIRRMKSSRQARAYPIRVLVLNFDAIRAICIDECLPEFEDNYGGQHLEFTGIVHAAFYGRKGDVVHMGEPFAKGRIRQDGRFVQGSGYHFALIRAEKQYGLLCNPYVRADVGFDVVCEALQRAYRPKHVLSG